MKSVHPIELYLLGLAKLWARFAFYGTSTMLVFFLVVHLHFADRDAYALFGGVMTAAFSMSVVGGWLSDHFLGYLNAAVLGCVLFIVGNLGLMLPGHYALYCSLASLSLGVGFFKPNISSLVACLYSPDDPRRNGAFTIVFAAGNLGIFLGIFVTGLVVRRFDWDLAHWVGVFTAAGALLTLVFSYKRLQQRTEFEKAILSHLKLLRIPVSFFVYLAIPLLIVVIGLLLTHAVVLGVLVAMLFAISIPYLLLMAKRDNDAEFSSVLAYLFIVVLFILFFMFFTQISSSISLYANRHVSRDIYGFIFPPSSLQSFTPLMVFLFAYGVVLFWRFLQKNNKDILIPAKLGWGFVHIALAFGLIAFGAYLTKKTGAESKFIWLFGAYFFLTIGELFIVPIGTSAVSKLAPQKMLSMMMGVLFLGSAVGNYLSAVLARFTAPPAKQVLSLADTAGVYAHEFFMIALLACVAALLSWGVVGVFRKLQVAIK